MHQRILDEQQISAFYHDLFVEGQIRDFRALIDVGGLDERKVVVDVGGGYGFFARGLQQATNQRVRVVDSDPQSIYACTAIGVDARLGDALSPEFLGDEEVICFNLILHHLVGRKASETGWLQTEALRVWLGNARFLFINEYIYDSYFMDLSGRLIYQITKSKFLSAIASAISKFAPSLRANTFGIGVRFRGHDEWIRLFNEAGFRCVSQTRGEEELLSLPRRLLLIKSWRRDSFLLVAEPVVVARKPMR